MESYLAKMKEYLNMESEIPYPEFSEYFQDYVGYLNANYETFDQEACTNARFIFSILTVNCEDRAKRKGPEAKKYKKMGEKSRLWLDAITLRLKKEGLTPEQIEEANTKISDAM